MGLVIDTNIFIDAQNDRIDISRFASNPRHREVFMAAITVSELLVGVHLAKELRIRVLRQSFAESIIARIPVLDFDVGVARIHAQLHAYFLGLRSASKGNAHDLLIAATAIAHGHTVITSNVRDFSGIPGLSVESPQG